MRPVFIGFVGHSGSGKTTLIERLIGIFSGRGYCVGAVKHDAHKFEIDYPGKDSYRMKHAGAKRVVISSKNKFALIEDRQEERSLDEIKQLFSDCDFVFIEGYKLEDLPKIEVHWNKSSEYLIDRGIKNIVLVVTDENRVFDVPTVHFSELNRVVDFIEQMLNEDT